MSGIDEESAGKKQCDKTRLSLSSHEDDTDTGKDIQYRSPPETDLVKVEAAQQAADGDQDPVGSGDKCRR